MPRFIQIGLIAASIVFLTSYQPTNATSETRNPVFDPIRQGNTDEGGEENLQCVSATDKTYSFRGSGHSSNVIPRDVEFPKFKPSLYSYLAPQMNQAGRLPKGMQLDDFIIFVAASGDAKIIILVINKLPCSRAGCMMLFFSVPLERETIVPLNMENAGAANFYSSTLLFVEFNNCGVHNFYFVEPSRGSHRQLSEDST